MCNFMISCNIAVVQYFIPYFLVMADSKPSMKMLQRHVIPLVATKWYELGAELFDEREEYKLDTIDSDHKRDANKCCFEMFRMWLQTHTNATWSLIVEALESPGINLLPVAADLRELTGKDNTYLYTNYYCSK